MLLKKKDKNYHKKRKNINKTRLKFDENNNLYLTLTKFEPNIKIVNKELGKNNPKNKSLDISDEEKQINPLVKLIPEFYENQRTKSEESDTSANFKFDNNSDSESEEILNEKDQKTLFDKLRTRKNFGKGDEISSIININQNQSDGNLTIEKERVNYDSSKGKNKSDYKSIFKGLDPVERVINVRKMKNKIKILKNETSREAKSQLDHITLFNYDKTKWDKQKLREADRILKHIQDFESRRKNMMNKIINVYAYSCNKSPKLTKRNSLLQMNHMFSADEMLINEAKGK